MRLCHNLMSLNVYRNYNKALVEQSDAMHNIESGSKLSNRTDFKGAFARSEEFNMQIKGLQMANKNLQDTYSMIQTVEGGLSEISDSLVRIKELTVEGATGTYNENDLDAMQKEINQLKGNISNIVEYTNFNGVKLMDNKEIDSSSKHKLADVVTGKLGSVSGSNVGDIIEIPQYSINIKNMGIDFGKSVEDIDVTGKHDKGLNISIVDKAIDQLSYIRSKYGAVEQRLMSSSDNINASIIPIKKAKSYISDSDVAKEMMKYVKADLLTQASNAMMVQSNNFPQDALRVLENLK